jgi:hypothetical protein
LLDGSTAVFTLSGARQERSDQEGNAMPKKPKLLGEMTRTERDALFRRLGVAPPSVRRRDAVVESVLWARLGFEFGRRLAGNGVENE